MFKTAVRRLFHKINYILDRLLSGESMNYRQVLVIILPLLVDQAFITMLSFVNTGMISSSGAQAVAAVNMVDSLNLFLLNVFVAISTGGTVIVAQYKGIENDKAVCKSASQSVLMVGIVSILIGLTVIALHVPLMGLLFGKAEQGVLDNARIYMIGSGITYPFFAISEAVCGGLRGVGETKSSLCLTTIMNGSYLLLNLLFINLLHWGVIGLVCSLFLSRLIGMICALVFIMKIHKTLNYHWKDIFNADFTLMRKILFIGLPFAAEQMFFNGGKLLTQTFIVQLGTSALFVNAVSSSIVGLYQIGGNACNLAIVTVVGQCIGRRDIKDARKFEHSFILLSTISFLLIEACIFPFTDSLIRFFTPPAETISQIHSILLITAVGYPAIWSFSFITPSSLRAAGDSRFTSLTSLLSMWLVRVVLGYFLSIVLHWGIVGVWGAMVFEWFVRAGIFRLRLHGDKWYRHQLVERQA